jgi:hypothetical protein
VLSKDANWNGRKEDAATYLNYMAKNFITLSCPRQSSFGYESGKGEKAYVELDSVIIPLEKAQRGMSHTHDPAVFWARP